jgi:hypothetical protein
MENRDIRKWPEIKKIIKFWLQENMDKLIISFKWHFWPNFEISSVSNFYLNWIQREDVIRKLIIESLRLRKEQQFLLPFINLRKVLVKFPL